MPVAGMETRAEQIAERLRAAGVPVKMVEHTRDPEIEDDCVYLTGGYYIQVGTRSADLNVNRMRRRQGREIMEHQCYTTTIDALVEWCLAKNLQKLPSVRAAQTQNARRKKHD